MVIRRLNFDGGALRFRGALKFALNARGCFCLRPRNGTLACPPEFLVLLSCFFFFFSFHATRGCKSGSVKCASFGVVGILLVMRIRPV